MTAAKLILKMESMATKLLNNSIFVISPLLMTEPFTKLITLVKILMSRWQKNNNQ